MQLYTPLCFLLLAALVSADGYNYDQDDDYDDAGGYYRYYGHVGK